MATKLCFRSMNPDGELSDRVIKLWDVEGLPEIVGNEHWTAVERIMNKCSGADKTALRKLRNTLMKDEDAMVEVYEVDA